MGECGDLSLTSTKENASASSAMAMSWGAELASCWRAIAARLRRALASETERPIRAWVVVVLTSVVEWLTLM